VSVTHYEDVDLYPLDPDVQERLLREQSECSFIWGTRDHWPVGVTMNYVWRDGSFWLTASRQRKRIAAIRRDPRVSLVVSSVGTSLGPARTLTAKGRVRIHEDRATKNWVYPAIATSLSGGQPDLLERFVKLLDSERRLVLEVVPEQYITFDSSKLMAATDWSAL
jgi:nitroimidazol reductase NimA-like FMN-containing flavoprotein (pyridoxamine 5'-phosphate oxidase superfamily)